MSSAPLEPVRPSPARHPIDTLSRASESLDQLETLIEEARAKMGRLGVKFSQAKTHLRELLRQRDFLKADQDEALAALHGNAQEQDQVQRVTSASSSSRPVSPTRKRPLPTGLVPQKKKKLAAEPMSFPPIWPANARR